MLSIRFRYADELSNWEWRTQQCVVSSVEQCKKLYGLDNDDVKYEILEVKEVDAIVIRVNFDKSDVVSDLDNWTTEITQLA